MKHPSAADLALYAGRDLPLGRRLRIALHLRRCPACRGEAASFREERNFVSAAAGDLPEYTNWPERAAEMRANIHVGLAAGECVAQEEPQAPRLGWRAAVALTSVTLVVLSGWWLLLPHAHPAKPKGVLLNSTSDGIEMVEAGNAVTLRHTSVEPVVLSVNVEGGLSEHFVDDETGMVTINNVLVQ